MENKTEIGQDNSKNIVKVSTLWYFVEWYLEMLQSTGAMYDKDFQCLYNQLLCYVSGKIDTRGINIISEYVIYEVEL